MTVSLVVGRIGLDVSMGYAQVQHEHIPHLLDGQKRNKVPYACPLVQKTYFRTKHLFDFKEWTRELLRYLLRDAWHRQLVTLEPRSVLCGV